MELEKNLLDQEVTILENVINKIQVYMNQNKQTLYGLATKMGFAYQPFYRLITKKHLPNLNSLSIIAKNFNCSVSELIHEDIFIDINCFNSFNDAASTANPSTIRIYIPYNQFLPLIHSNVLAIKTCALEQDKFKDTKNQSVNYSHTVFYQVDNINIDGVFLVNFRSENLLVEVLSVSSKYIIAIIEGKETKLDLASIKPIAQFLSHLILVDKERSILVGLEQKFKV